jgi:ABC-type antimicrobial peptide transport system permease subunit
MSVLVSTVGRRPAVLTGFIGLLLGTAFGIGLAFAIMSAAEQPTAGANSIRGTTPSDSQSQAVREFGHLLRTYGTASVAGPAPSGFAEGQRQALREFGYLLREYGTASVVAPAPSTLAEQQRQVLREFGYLIRQYPAASAAAGS